MSANVLRFPSEQTSVHTFDVADTPHIEQRQTAWRRAIGSFLGSGGSFCLSRPSGADLVVAVAVFFRCEMGCANRYRGRPFISVFSNALLLAYSRDACRMDVPPALRGDYGSGDSVIHVSGAHTNRPNPQQHHPRA